MRPLQTSGLRAVRSDGVAALAERVLADLDGVVERMVEAYRTEIPEYAALSQGQLAIDVLPVSRRLVTTFLACVVESRSLTPRELEVFEQSGRQRLIMGMPLESVLHAYRIAGREAWTALCSHLPPTETALLADLGARWMDIVDRTSSALAPAYLAASHERLRHVDARRRELVEALLTATDPSEVAAVSLRFSTVLAPAYVPVLGAGSGAAAGIDALLGDAPAGTLGGHRCGSPALTGETLCHFHTRVKNATRVRSGSSVPSIMLPEDAESVQGALMQVIDMLLKDQMEVPKARLVLRAIELASRNVKNLQAAREKPTPGAAADVPDQPAEDRVIESSGDRLIETPSAERQEIPLTREDTAPEDRAGYSKEQPIAPSSNPAI